METEIWKDIKGYEGLYQVSTFGRIKSLNYNREKREQVLLGKVTNSGYIRCRLSGRYFSCHRLVAQAFLGLDINNRKMLVCHKDDNPLNNKVDNLFLGTHKDNTQDCISKGRFNIGISKYRKINQFTKQGEFIKEWESVGFIYKSLGIAKGNIINCCKGKLKSAGGYIWKY